MFNKITWHHVGAGLLVFLALVVYDNAESWRQKIALEECAPFDDQSQIACIMRVVRTELHSYGLATAMDAFTAGYARYHSFASSGCHTWAHRVGDMVYYEIFLGHGNIKTILLPSATAACGYGFYHGFIEHYTQDHPTADDVTEICNSLQERLHSDLPIIRLTCYHAAGHGFMLAYGSHNPRTDWGKLNVFTAKPAERCLALPSALDGEKEQCLEGIFNVVVEWMEDKQYGFSYNQTNPFAACLSMPDALHEACYYEMAQKLDSPPTDATPPSLVKMVDTIPEEKFKVIEFGVGMAGIIQRVVDDPHGAEDQVQMCSPLPQKYHDECIRAIVHGLFAHGEPGVEYEKALTLCSDPYFSNAADRQMCYDEIVIQSGRQYPAGKLTAVCKLIPENARSKCSQQNDLKTNQDRVNSGVNGEKKNPNNQQQKA